nr:hypothetical protein [Maridesulfovibrio sp.]
MATHTLSIVVNDFSHPFVPGMDIKRTLPDADPAPDAQIRITDDSEIMKQINTLIK